MQQPWHPLGVRCSKGGCTGEMLRTELREEAQAGSGLGLCGPGVFETAGTLEARGVCGQQGCVRAGVVTWPGASLGKLFRVCELRCEGPHSAVTRGVLAAVPHVSHAWSC